MIDILPELIVGTNPLDEFRQKIQASIDANFASDKRLRTACEAIIMLEVAAEALQRVEKDGFVESFKQKIDETRQNATRILAEEASALRTRLEEVEAEATALRDEVKARGRCIDDVREEISTYLPADDTVSQLRATANDALSHLERIIKGAVDTRQRKNFADLVELASDSTSPAAPPASALGSTPPSNGEIEEIEV
ncbi:MAG: hypothetical protein NC241_10185 [Bacteroides sp.]|nr:hypothetical protein [Bacteroides sp.]MCM1457572.1 hypothetical protein [Lachnoclostridium sp.]